MPLFGWSLAIGDLRIAHFIGLHAMQIIPLSVLGATAVVGRPAQWFTLAATSAVLIWATVHAHDAAWAGIAPFGL